MQRIFFRFVASFVGFAILWAAGFGLFLLHVPTVENADVRRVDAVVVLTGGAGRIDHGLKRIKEGKAKQIFISGVNDAATAEHIIHNTLLHKAPNLLETDNPQLSLGYEATSTIGNADEVTAWVRKRQIRSIRLVTANYHMLRSLLEFRKAMPKDIEIIADPMFPEGFSLADWWRTGNSSRLLFNEYHKMLAAYLRHALIAWHKKVS